MFPRHQMIDVLTRKISKLTVSIGLSANSRKLKTGDTFLQQRILYTVHTHTGAV